MSRNLVGTLIPVLIPLLVVRTVANYVTNEHQNFILDGVKSVQKTCFPATVSLLNEKSFPILTGESDGIRRAHVAGVEWGNGRIVAFSHTSFYLDDLPNGSDNVKLLINSVEWVRRKSGKKIGVFAEKEVENVLLKNGFKIQVLSPDNLNNLAILQQYDALAITGNSSGLANIRTYVRNGGGLLIGATAWAIGANEIESFWGNVVLRDTGIFYIRFASYGSKSCDYQCFDASKECLENTSAFQVWKDLKEFNWKQSMPRTKLKQMMAILLDRLRDAPRNEALNDEIRVEIKRIFPLIPTVFTTATAPATQENEKNFIVAHKEWTFLFNFIGATYDIPAHPTAMSFPGVASSGKLPTKNQYEIIEIDGSVSWHSTGLYARAGEEIKFRSLNGGTISDVEVQIGVHSDNLENLSSWKRSPAIVFRNKMENGMATIANPFGGAIYIVLSTRQNSPLTFLIEGGIRSPSYFVGKTSLTQWKNEIRNYAAPWGELVGKKLIMSVQASHLSKLNDPTEVIDMWDRIMDTIADLAVIPRERDAPSRFVADVQISGGYMHAGYPIMYYLESQAQSINIAGMKRDPWLIWGFLHEIGHNHQKDEWIFEGTREVSTNLFALYVLHTIFNCPTNSTPSYSDAAVAQRLKTYVENGKQFSHWQTNYDLAFDTYVQLQKAFGWSAYKKIFANYQQLSQNDRPKNDQEKIDLWMVMFSRAVQENLADFFISWGFPISNNAIALVNHLRSTRLRIPELK